MCARHCVLISKQRRRKDDPRPQRVHSVKTHKWLTQRHVNGRDKRSARCASTGVAQDRGLPTQVAGLSFSNCPASYSRSPSASDYYTWFIDCRRSLITGALLGNSMPLLSSRASQVALVVKHPPANARDMRDIGSIPGSGRSPGKISHLIFVTDVECPF